MYLKRMSVKNEKSKAIKRLNIIKRRKVGHNWRAKKRLYEKKREEPLN